MKSLVLLPCLAAAVLSASGADVRLQPPKDLDGYFPWDPPASKEAWAKRSQQVREQMLVSLGLWPMPTKTPLNAVIHGKIDRGDYTVEKVYFESVPGFFVTGSLYRPKPGVGAVGADGKRAGVLCPHGHWNDGRFTDKGEAAVQAAIKIGDEKFEDGGRSPLQARCVHLARMGCVVFHYDMLGNADSVQIPLEIVHGFKKQRPEMNAPENWGLFSPQAEGWCQSIMGLQALNSIRSLDFIETLPDVDAKRIGCTGASGGGTQTFILGAIDPRLAAEFPAVMVSTSMQGGCTCENCSGLRIGTGNIEFAALFAPKPLAMTCANDWTKEMETKGFPQLKRHYEALGVPANVQLTAMTQFEHNYNYPSRAAMYAWFNQHLNLGLPADALIEKDYHRLTKQEMSVWDQAHPAPTGDAIGPAFEKKLLRWWKDDAEKQLKEKPALARTGWRVVIGRTLDEAGDKFSWDRAAAQKDDKGDYVEMRGPVVNESRGEEVDTTFLFPKQWNGTVTLWFDGQAAVNEDAAKLARDGTAVVISRLFMPDAANNRTVKNTREAPAYTYGYNHALFAQRVHDVLTLIQLVRKNEKYHATSIRLVGRGSAAPIVAAARAMAGDAIASAAIEKSDFRFINIPSYVDINFLPGAAKYGDLPGLLAQPGAKIE